MYSILRTLNTAIHYDLLVLEINLCYQAYRNENQFKVTSDTCDKEISRSNSKRSHDAMEETDHNVTNYEAAMNVCMSECEDNKQDSMYFICKILCYCVHCSFNCS